MFPGKLKEKPSWENIMGKHHGKDRIEPFKTQEKQRKRLLREFKKHCIQATYVDSMPALAGNERKYVLFVYNIA